VRSISRVAGELTPVNPATLEPVGSVPVSAPEEELSRVKFADLDRGRVPVPWWFPYDDRAADAFRAALAVLYGRGKLGAAWRHRRGLVELGRRYLR
jgi:hypothetical protein